MNEESYVVGREQCPKCAEKGFDRSGDNLVMYSDEHKYCYRCEYYVPSNNKENKYMEPVASTFKKYNGSCVDIVDRKIDHKTCRKYGYQVATVNGTEMHIAPYYANGELVAQHLRGPDKQFKWSGSPSKCELFGQNLFKSSGGKRLVITEGELDCLTVSQLLGTWPVVSVPNGAASAMKYIKANLEFVTSYEEIVLMFDMDAAGQEAARKIAEILPPGRAKIAKLPYKDASDCYVKGNSKAVVTAVWEAQSYSPDEIVHVSDIEDSGDDFSISKVWAFPWDNMTEFCLGQRSGEITLHCSGTGSGKTTILREIIHNHLSEGRSVGAIMLEESPKETIDDMVSLILNKPVRAIRASRMMNKLRVKMGKEPINMEIIDDLSDEEYTNARKELANTSFYVYDHLGNNGMSNLLARMEFMAISLGVEVIVLDHITAAAAGLMGITNKDIDGGSSERLIIDSIMKELRALCVRTGVHIDIVSQLKKTDKAYEEGNRITLQDLRGSGALSSVPNTVIALERNRQDPDPIVSNTTIVRVLKNRLTGRCGIASALYYDHTTSRLTEKDFAFGDNGEVLFEANPFGEGKTINED